MRMLWDDFGSSKNGEIADIHGEEGTNERTAVMNGTRSIEKDCYIKPKKAWRLLKTADDENVTAYIYGVSGTGKSTLICISAYQSA